MTDNTTQPVAGWYPAPHANNEVRYWDGSQWTEWTPESAEAARQSVATMEQPSADASQEPQPVEGAVAPTTKRRLPWWAWLLIAFGAIIVLGAIIGAIGGGSPSAQVEPAVIETPTPVAVAPVEEEVEEVERVEVPDLVGMTVADARAAIEGLGLTFKTLDGAGDDWVITTQTITQPTELGTEIFAASEAPKPVLSLAQQNAVREAESYLGFTAFSRVGLIEQLEYEGYSTEDATFAVDFVNPDWNAECAEDAADYLEFTSFSREGLYEQLAYEGYTPEQIEFGLAAVGY